MYQAIAYNTIARGRLPCLLAWCAESWLAFAVREYERPVWMFGRAEG